MKAAMKNKSLRKLYGYAVLAGLMIGLMTAVKPGKVEREDRRNGKEDQRKTYYAAQGKP
jgi:hypothetical protein